MSGFAVRRPVIGQSASGPVPAVHCEFNDVSSRAFCRSQPENLLAAHV